MAAPGYLYTHKLPAFSLSEAEKRVLLTSSSETVETLKSRFYLDGFIRARKDGELKWAGFCIVGSVNYYMHNTARHGYMRAKHNGQDIVVFWDAGLNTLGRNVISDLKSDLLFRGVLISLDVYPAWYTEGQYWVRFREASSLNWTSWTHAGNVTEGQYLNGGMSKEVDRYWNLSDLFPDFKAGKIYFMQSKHVNVEGESISDERSVTIVVAPIEMKRGPSPRAAYESTIIFNIYTNSADLEIGTRLYEDEKMQEPVASGYHMPPDSTSWYRVDLQGYIIERGSYVEPIQKLVYDLGIIRLDEGRSKVGDIEFGRSVTSTSTVNEFWGPIAVAVGTHDGSFNDFRGYVTFQVSGGIIAPGQVIPISELSSIDESYNLYNWGYIITINGQLYTRDNF